MSLIKIQNQNIVLEEKVIVENINLEINRGDFVLFSGRTGSGKTTLINQIVNTRDEITARVFQDPTQQFTMDNPFDELVFLLENLQTDPKKIKKIALDTLTEFHLIDKKDQKISTLSGGEQQRLALAQALLIDSDLIILDEPFANVDKTNSEFLMQKIISFFSKNKTIIVADHNPLIYKKFINKIFVFNKKRVSLLTKNETVAFFKKDSKKITLTSRNRQLALFKYQNFSISELINGSNFEIPIKSKTLLIGENGSGKSTFFSANFKLAKFKGEIKDETKNKLLAFQHASDSFLKLTVADEIAFAKKTVFNKNKMDVEYWMEKFDLVKLLNSSVYTLSGGEQKKLQLLSLLIQNPQAIFLDEPFSGLDQNSVRVVLNLLSEYEGTLLLISHQFNQLEKFIDYVIKIEDKKIKEIREVKI